MINWPNPFFCTKLISIPLCFASEKSQSTAPGVGSYRVLRLQAQNPVNNAMKDNAMMWKLLNSKYTCLKRWCHLVPSQMSIIKHMSFYFVKCIREEGCGCVWLSPEFRSVIDFGSKSSSCP